MPLTKGFTKPVQRQAARDPEFLGAVRNGNWRYTPSPRRRVWYTDKGDILNQSDPSCSIASA
jgi:hypothetical protein